MRANPNGRAGRMLPICLLSFFGCSLDTVPLERPSVLQPGSGCLELGGSYANVSDAIEGYLLSQLFFDLEPGQHLAVSTVQLQALNGSSITVTAWVAGRALAPRVVMLHCDEGRWSLPGPAGWRTEGAGIVALLRRSHRVWLARDNDGALVTEVRQKNTGLLLASIPVATYHTPHLRRYRGMEETKTPATSTAEGVAVTSVCAGDPVAFCALGLTLDEEGGLSSENLWSLLIGQSVPEGLTHVDLQAAQDGVLWLTGWAGADPVGRNPLDHLGIRCEAGDLKVHGDAQFSVLGSGTGALSVAGMGVGLAWGKLQLARAEDGALLVRTLARYAGTVAVLLPIYLDLEDWYRFAAVTPANGWLTCPFSPRA